MSQPQTSITATRTAAPNTRQSPHKIPSHYINSDTLYKDFLRMVRLEPFFRGLPKNREQNPEQYDRIRVFFKRLIDDGGLNIFPDGSSLHQLKPGQMQIILAGTAQMRHNKYSREIPSLAKVGFDGPTFSNGQAIGSWAMAGMTGSHFGDIFAIGPVMTLSLAPHHYGELIRLTLDKAQRVSQSQSLSHDEVLQLKKSGVLLAYSQSDEELLRIPRQRDFDKRQFASDSVENTSWKKGNLAEADFLIKYGNEWHAVRHPFQSAIKDATVTQHILQKNFLPDEKLLEPLVEPNVAPLFRTALENDEFIALSRSCAPAKILPGYRINKDTVILCLHPFQDAEKPPQPMKLQSPTSLGTVSFQVTDARDEYSVVDIPLASDGVIDVAAIQKKLQDEGTISHEQRLTAMSVVSQTPLQYYHVDLGLYRDQLLRNSSLSLQTFFNTVENFGYVLSESTRKTVNDLLYGALPPPESESSLHRRLSYQDRRLALSALQLWAARDSKEKMVAKDVDLSPEKIHELSQVLDVVMRHTRGESDLTKSYQELPDKIRAVASRALEISIPLSLGANYRDVKFLQEEPADPTFDKRPFESMHIRPFGETADLTWARNLATPVVVIPDRHENLLGLQHELQGLRLHQDTGDVQFNNDRPIHTIFLGDLINRRVSLEGFATFNTAHHLLECSQLSQHTVSLICGNHELDLMKMSPQALASTFRGFASYVIAYETQSKLRKLGSEGSLKAAVVLGGAPQHFESCVVTHAGLDPRLKVEIVKALSPSTGTTVSDEALVSHLNAVFRDACEKGDWSHPIFAKSERRGGTAKYSGIFELDMQAHDKSDLGGILAEGITTFTPQIHGHSFSSDAAAILPRLDRRTDGSPISTSINVDGGDHQVFDGNPLLRLHSLVIAPPVNDSLPSAHITSVTLGHPPHVPSSEQEVYDLYKAHRAAQDLSRLSVS